MIRTRFAALRTLPSNTVFTFSRSPTMRRSTCLPLNEKGRSARGNSEFFDLCQGIDDFFGDAVREELVLGVCAHVCERQDRDGGLSSCSRSHALGTARDFPPQTLHSLPYLTR